MSLPSSPAAQLEELPPEAEGSFPDLLFPPNRTWVVSLPWDDGWRSVGASEAVVRRIEQQIPAFERLNATTDLVKTGRVEN